MRQKNERNIDLVYSSRTQDRILDHRILRSEVHPHSYIFLDIQWIHEGSSCILLRSLMSKVSCLQIHNDRKEILSSFVTKEKIICNRRPKKNPTRQIRLNDRLNINANMWINIPDLEVAYLSSHEGSMTLQHF